jgi:hypothetical protein
LRGDHRVDDIVPVDADDAQPVPGAAVVLGVRVHQQGVARQFGGDGAEPVDEGAVDVVGDDQQPGVAGRHDVLDLVLHRVRERQRRRVAGVDQADQPHRGVGQLRHLLRRVAPSAYPGLGEAARLHPHHVELVGVQLRDLDVGGEHRHHQRDPVALPQHAVLHQRVEDVAHGGGAALGGEEVEPGPGRRPAVHQLLLQVAAHHLLSVDQHPVRLGVVVTDDAVGELVDPLVAVEAEADGGQVDAVLEQGDARQFGVRGDERVEASCTAVLLRHAAEIVGGPHPAALGEGEVAQREAGLARPGRDPVGVPAARVEHRPGAAALLHGLVGPVPLGEGDELALQLERAEGGQPLHFLTADGGLGHEASSGVVEGRSVGSGEQGDDDRAPDGEQHVPDRVGDGVRARSGARQRAYGGICRIYWHF